MTADGLRSASTAPLSTAPLSTAPLSTAPLSTAPVFRPITIGTLELEHRIVVPPHGGGNSKLIGSADEFDQLCAMWLAKAEGGIQWLGGPAIFVANPMPPGFEPSGVGAHGPGYFRAPDFADRMGRFAGLLHGAGAVVSCQMVQQAGMPTGSSATYSGYLNHSIAHALQPDEVQWLIQEYVWSAKQALDAGVDAIEIHANHDDVVQWFLSPATNLRTDGYGGSLEGRRRFLREICEGIKGVADRPFTFGLRLNLDERIDAGYDIDGCTELVSAFTADGTLDYFSFDIGGNWDDPSYIQIPWYPDTGWAEMCGQVKAATHLPVVYAGCVTSVEQAAQVIDAGHADVVAMARASMADPDFLAKARSLALASGDKPDPVRPCIGLNECINRRLVEGLPHACGVNPHFAREHALSLRPAPQPRRGRDGKGRIGIVGAGPAGTELAIQCVDRGLEPIVWERAERVGGALNIAALARGNHTYRRWIEYQAARLDQLGIELHLETVADIDTIAAADVGIVAVATGATPRVPPIPGVDAAHVYTAAAALQGAELGERVLVISEDDGPAPMSVTHELASRGHRCTLVHQGTEPSPLVGRYSKGGMLAMLVNAGVAFVPMARVTAIGDQVAALASTYGRRTWESDEYDSVVLTCGSIGNDVLHQQVKAAFADLADGTAPELHLLGDAFAPRRVVFATRQAFALADVLAGQA